MCSVLPFLFPFFAYLHQSSSASFSLFYFLSSSARLRTHKKPNKHSICDNILSCLSFLSLLFVVVTFNSIFSTFPLFSFFFIIFRMIFISEYTKNLLDKSITTAFIVQCVYGTYGSKSCIRELKKRGTRQQREETKTKKRYSRTKSIKKNARFFF